MAGTESGDQDHEAEERREEGRDSGGSCGESIGVDNLPVSGPSSAGVEITKKEEMVVMMETEADTDTDVRLGGLRQVMIEKLVENLSAEGIKGEIASVNGVDIEGAELILHDGLKVRKHASF